MTERERLEAAAKADLLPYQRAWVDDGARLKIGMWARQTGKTFAATFEMVSDLARAGVEGRRSPWLVLSRGERQAREAMRAGVRAHARSIGAIFRELERDVAIGAATVRAAEWDAGGGNVITALPANPDTARGYARNVYLDEFAIHRRDRELWAAVFPTVTRGWRLRVTSTPKGKRGKFHELMADDGAAAALGWSRHTVGIHRAVGEGLGVDADGLRAGLADDELWRQEYLCEWLDEAGAWLPWELVDSCVHPDAGDPARFAGGAAFIGVDIAARAHLWAAWAIELVGDVAWTRELRVLRGGTFAERDDALADMIRRFRPVRVAADATGVGAAVVEGWRRAHGAARVEPVVFTPARKLDLATALRRRFEDRAIRIPPDAALRADLHGVRRAPGPTGAPRLVADADGEGHGDRFWAGALACAAAVAAAPAAGASAGDRGAVRAAYAPRPRSRR